VTRLRARRHSARDVVVLTIGLGVAIGVNVAFIWGPTLASIALSGTDWNGISEIRWVGGENYHDLATSYPPFWTAVRNNMLWLAFLGLIATPFGLFCAVLLDRRIRFSRVYQGALYMPVVLSLAVVGFIAQLVYSQDYGVLNAVTGMGTDWLGDPSINIWVVMVAAAWRHVGYVMIIYLAGLKAVDPALKEAAAIDGASETQAFFQVVFPTLRPINVIVFVITVIEALRAFDIVYAINKGRNGLELLSVLVTENIVGEASRIGFGSAIAVVLLVISMGFIIVYLTQLFREER
jgi:multiple sugar transport system permease protein